MDFPDFPFPDDVPSYVHHSTVLNYIENYAKHFNLLQYVRFQTKVILVEPLTEKEFSKSSRWSVKYQQNGCPEQQEEFDAVIVCSG